MLECFDYMHAIGIFLRSSIATKHIEYKQFSSSKQFCFCILSRYPIYTSAGCICCNWIEWNGKFLHYCDSSRTHTILGTAEF